MMTVMTCSLLVLLVLGWVLCTNANDREVFDRELEEHLEDRSDDGPS